MTDKKKFSRSHDAVIRVCDDAGNVIETHEASGGVQRVRDCFPAASQRLAGRIPRMFEPPNRLFPGSHVRELYEKNPRHRSYSLTPDSQRALAQLYGACLDESEDAVAAQRTFEWAVEQFADAGVNVLRPRPSDELKPSEMWKDSMPATFPTGKTFNLTIQGAIARNPRLDTLLDSMNRHETQFIEESRAAARASIEAAQKNLKELEADIARHRR